MCYIIRKVFKLTNWEYGSWECKPERLGSDSPIMVACYMWRLVYNLWNMEVIKSVYLFRLSINRRQLGNMASVPGMIELFCQFHSGALWKNGHNNVLDNNLQSTQADSYTLYVYVRVRDKLKVWGTKKSSSHLEDHPSRKTGATLGSYHDTLSLWSWRMNRY